jgi:N-acetylglucosamine kinase-like BadF-type ATPase
MSWLGLDVGGTQCRYEWWPPDSRPGGCGRGVQPAVHGVAAAVEGLAGVLAAAVREAPAEAVVCAMAGAGDPAVGAAIVDGLRARAVAGRAAIAVVGDVLAAAAAALQDGAGVLVWSGTGSFAVARSSRGELVRVGGRGYLLGDQGSGFDFVRRAAAAVLLAADDLGPPTALTDALTAAFEAPSPQRLGAVLQHLDTGAVAAKLPVVLGAAAAGDAVAAEVLDEGVEALAMLANAAVRRAGLEFTALPTAFGGGVLTSVPAVRERLAVRLRTFGAPAPRVLDARVAARGAAWLAHGLHQGLEPQRSWVAHGTL